MKNMIKNEKYDKHRIVDIKYIKKNKNFDCESLYWIIKVFIRNFNSIKNNIQFFLIIHNTNNFYFKSNILGSLSVTSISEFI
jgi:hypothetical protein